jgi:hypothetical protein
MLNLRRRLDLISLSSMRVEERVGPSSVAVLRRVEERRWFFKIP